MAQKFNDIKVGYSLSGFFIKVKKLKRIVTHYSSITLLCFVGTLMSYATFYAVNHYEEQNSHQQLQISFKDKVTSLTQAISAIDKVFLASQSLLEIKRQLSQKNFAQLITEDFLLNTGMQGVEWAPAIPKSQTASFERKVRDDGVFDYQIRDILTSENTCPSENKNIIFPVLFAQPADVIGHELGLLLSSDCAIATSMKNAFNSRTITSTNFYNEQNELGFRLLKAVFDNNDNLRGYILGIVMINQLIDTLWGDITNSKNYKLSLFNHSGESQKIYDSQWKNNCIDDCSLSLKHTKLSATIPFANQIWSIEFSKMGEEPRSHLYAYIAAIFILLLTLGLSIYLWMNVNRVRWANNLVKERTESLQYQAKHDDLTQLLNKQALSFELEKLIKEYKQYNKVGFSLLFIDLDHFKKVNDTKGHLVGDKLLQQVAQRLQQAARFNDSIFRFGGDEFAVILHNNNGQATVTLTAERILKRLEKTYIIDNNKYRIGASIGVSMANEISLTSSEIIRNADIAMYEAKKQGRGKVVFYQTEMHKRLVKKQAIEDELENAIQSKQLSVYLQPIHKNEQLKGFEALSRWLHPEKGMIFPDEFISVAEETGMIHLLGQWLIDSTCQQLASWIQSFGIDACPYISINVSSIQLSQREVVEQIAKALQRHNIPGKLLAVELTESALIDNKIIVKQNLLNLQSMGVRIFLDDFGTGFSSLSLLQDFPIDVLKIDRSFVVRLEEDNQDSQKLVKAMINMAQALNMQVVAEGVDNVNTLNWLHAENCHLIQGYYFSKPLAPKAVDSYVKKHKISTTSPFSTKEQVAFIPLPLVV
jgi:diguanylate cyclase (GGDEF)-like protein